MMGEGKKEVLVNTIRDDKPAFFFPFPTREAEHDGLSFLPFFPCSWRVTSSGGTMQAAHQLMMIENHYMRYRKGD